MRTFLGLGLVLVSLVGCDRERTDADPYRIVIDGGVQIRAFGEDTFSADEAADLLVRLGPTAVPALAAALEREPADIRAKAVEVLATIGSADAVPALVGAAQQDDDPDVRGDALRALGAIGDPRGLPPVEAALGDTGVTVRAGGVMACASLCAERESVERLAEIAVRDPNVSVALAARTSLMTIRERDAERATLVRGAIARHAPGSTPDERALVALLTSDLDPAGAETALVAALPAASAPLQRQLLWRLGAVGHEGAAPAVAALLASDDVTTRNYAYDTLVRLRDRGVGEAGAALSRHPGPPLPGRLAPPEF